mmetsp:Transcript_10285/g.34290  ORF Transcript_10285/g.34290 Transcript_10285/m.34290 type:complete len:291 (+) Transcript_10285:1014-1886(+)
MRSIPAVLLILFVFWDATNGFLIQSSNKLFSSQAPRGLHLKRQTSPRFQRLVTQAKLGAIIFACDGVLVDSERDGHRVALNAALKEVRPDLECSVEEYGRLLQVRGEEKLSRLWDEMGWDGMNMDLAIQIYNRKSEIFTKMLEDKKLPIRPGVLSLVDEAIAAGIPLAVCSSNTQKNVELIIESMGPQRAKHFSIFAGGRVVHRKPSPDIYNLCKGSLSLHSEDVVIIEDDLVGLQAAKAAHCACLITKSTYSVNDDFKTADLVVDDLKKGEVDLNTVSRLPLSMVGVNA